jgi:septum formation protein
VNIRLASGSAIRRQMLEAAGVKVDVVKPRVDEISARDALLADGARPREVADALAGLKARRVGEAHPGGITLGCDQVLEFEGTCYGKPETPDDAVQSLLMMAGKTHQLHSAAVAYETGKPVWRHISTARLTMLPLSETYVRSYVARNWEQIRHSAGAYQIEAEGIRLFSSIGTDYHAILGLPLLPLLGWLRLRGELEA